MMMLVRTGEIMMKQWMLCLFVLTGLVTNGAIAQKWTAYTPPERDFRVVFPDPPVETQEAGSALYKTGDEIEFRVYRHKGYLAPDADIPALLEQRLRNAFGEDRDVVRIINDDEIPEVAGQYVFRIGGGTGFYSMHRIARGAGYYYEVMVLSRVSNRGRAAQYAQDFFGTFYGGSGLLLPGIGTLAGVVDQICATRTDRLSRTFCELRACFGNANDPQSLCGRLFGR